MRQERQPTYPSTLITISTEPGSRERGFHGYEWLGGAPLALGVAHRQRLPTLDGVRVQDIGLSGQPDPVVLAWAAQTDRVILPHDVSTMTAHAYAHIADGLPMVGVFAVSQFLSISQALDDLYLLAECSLAGEWKVRYLPL